MANEYKGFSGSTIKISLNEYNEIQHGFKGSSFVPSLKQYVEPSYGFKGSTVEIVYKGNSTKITHFK